MKAWELLGETSAPDGTDIRLTRRAGEYVILANGKPLMSSRLHGSEEALATLGCTEARRLTRPRVLVGGLGMGFTLRAVLDVLPPPPSWSWPSSCRPLSSGIAARSPPSPAYPLRDPRVRVEVADVGFTLRANPGQFDAILLDVDNGPAAFTVDVNAGLYNNSGVAAAYAALCPRGTLAIWSAWEDTSSNNAFAFTDSRSKSRGRARLKKGGPRHTIFLGHKGRSGPDLAATRIAQALEPSDLDGTSVCSLWRSDSHFNEIRRNKLCRGCGPEPAPRRTLRAPRIRVLHPDGANNKPINKKPPRPLCSCGERLETLACTEPIACPSRHGLSWQSGRSPAGDSHFNQFAGTSCVVAAVLRRLPQRPLRARAFCWYRMARTTGQ